MIKNWPCDYCHGFELLAGCPKCGLNGDADEEAT
jgi:hypothetical protein